MKVYVIQITLFHRDISVNVHRDFLVTIVNMIIEYVQDIHVGKIIVFLFKSILYLLRNNGTCTEINTTISGDIETSYSCQCVYGYDGTNCELVSDLCGNITCEYDGVCISSYLMWSCQCLDSSLYSGIYCQDKSSALITKQILCRSFAIAAIIALCCVFAFVFTMDILKYVLKIEPVERKRHRLRMKQKKKEQKKFRKKIKKKTQIIITRFSTV